MDLTPKIRQEIDWLEEHKEEYPYREGGLGEKVALLVIGGTGFGKSYVIKETSLIGRALGLDINEAGSVTTRKRKPTDPAHYRTSNEGITHDSFIESVRRGGMVNWSFIPRTGHLYGSDIRSFDSKVTLVPALPSSIRQIMKAGFSAVHVVYIIPDANSWHNRFLTEIESGDPFFYDRLDEARSSIEYAMSNPDNINMLRAVNKFNDPSHLRGLTHGLLEVCKKPDNSSYSQSILGDDVSDGFDFQAGQMLAMIDDLIRSREQLS